MSSMEDIIQAACRDRDIPGAVLVATDKTGTYAADVLTRIRIIAKTIFQASFNTIIRLEFVLLKMGTTALLDRTQ